MAFQRSSWSLVLVTVFVVACGQQSAPDTNSEVEVSGSQLYSENCKICHGDDGKAGISGASDLSRSTLNSDSVAHLILKGKKSMPPFSFLFEEDNTALERVVDHVQSLREK